MIDMTSCHPSRTDRNTMKIRNVSTGLVSERHAPDAHEMVASGFYEFVPADSPSIAEILARMGPVELARLAAQTDGRVRTYNETPHDIVAALVPFVEQGVVALGADRNAGRATPTTPDSNTDPKEE